MPLNKSLSIKHTTPCSYGDLGSPENESTALRDLTLTSHMKGDSDTCFNNFTSHPLQSRYLRYTRVTRNEKTVVLFDDTLLSQAIRQLRNDRMRFPVLTATSLKTISWDVAPCSLVETGRRIRGAYCLPTRNTTETSVSFYETTWRNIPLDKVQDTTLSRWRV
jgi:hypothetical protein